MGPEAEAQGFWLHRISERVSMFENRPTYAAPYGHGKAVNIDLRRSAAYLLTDRMKSLSSTSRTRADTQECRNKSWASGLRPRSPLAAASATAPAAPPYHRALMLEISALTPQSAQALIGSDT